MNKTVCPTCEGNDDECQDCCPHDEFDHGQCLGCGWEKDPGHDIDRAMDLYERDQE